MSHNSRSSVFPDGRRSLSHFIILYAVMYCSFGAASPFMPAFIESRGITPEQIGLIFAAGTAVRLISAPVAGRAADAFRSLRLTLAVCALLSACVGLGYLTVSGFWLIFVIAMLHAITLAPLTNLADALALLAARQGAHQRFEYGWVRGAGSAAFIAGSLIGGISVAAYGLGSVIWIQTALLLTVPIAVVLIAGTPTNATAFPGQPTAGTLSLFRLPGFRRVVWVAALILGSHAMHDTFAVIRWTAAGISPQTVTILWSMAVASEVVVFFFVGPWLLDRFSPAGAVAIAAGAGALRWAVASMTTDIAVLALIQPLHGLTFALLHLACMRLLARIVPSELAATSLAVYGTVGAGIAGAVVTLGSGWLYARLGGGGFIIMSLLCLVALPFAHGLRDREQARG